MNPRMDPTVAPTMVECEIPARCCAVGLVTGVGSVLDSVNVVRVVNVVVTGSPSRVRVWVTIRASIEVGATGGA